MKEWISGRNPVYEVLRAGRRQVFRLWAAEGIQDKGHLIKVQEMCAKRKCPIERVPRTRLDSIAENHQGIALETSAYPYSNLPEILDLADHRQEPPFLLLLDTLQDPQNLGTLLRTAEVVGVHGVLLPFRRTATVTPAVVHASSGACEHLLIAQLNLHQAIDLLKKRNIWVVGLEGGREAQEVNRARLDGPLAFVVGNEGEGMRPLIRSACDVLVRLPMRGQVESLNAAVAGSVALYFAWQARQFI
jgi:23S rRNA (guanosine2251-2'-O)-methyltransferase